MRSFRASAFRTLAISLALAATAMVAACGQPQADQEVVLRIGDQLGGVRNLLTAADEHEPEGYRLGWSDFQGGPAVIAAQTGGSVDIGFMAETPLIFAQAAGSPVKVIAVSRPVQPGTSNYALLARPDSPINSVADLRGRSVAYMPGTAMHYVLIRLLENAGLSLSDIRSVELSNLSTGLLASGDIDAVVASEPLAGLAVAAGEARIVATGGEPLTPEFTYLVATERALADPRLNEAIRDLVLRTARATRWRSENPDLAAPSLARLYGVPEAIVIQYLRRAPGRFAPIDAHVLATHQAEADVFLRLGLIRTRLETADIFDDRFNADILALAAAETEAHAAHDPGVPTQ